MARIESLSMLLEVTGKDYLAEQYGKVIENIEKSTISGLLKNTDLSGNPSAASVEAKRFENASSVAYGTARAAVAGTKVTAKPVTISIDTDKEIIEEIEQKDVSLYGVSDVVSRRVSNHGKSMMRELEKSFFVEALAEGTEFTNTGSQTIDQDIEELIQSVETTSNDFVDGVDRDMISVVMSPAKYGALRKYIDSTDSANIMTDSNNIALFHGVRVYSSVYLPTGTYAIAMVDGAVAQPVLPTIANPAKIQLSNAIGFGIFYSFGTKCVMPDLIKYTGSFSSALADLTVTSAEGTASGNTKLTVAPVKATANHYVYKTGATVAVVSKYDDVSSWTAWNGTADLTATTGQEIAVVEANKFNKAIKGGKATVVSKA